MPERLAEQCPGRGLPEPDPAVVARGGEPVPSGWNAMARTAASCPAGPPIGRPVAASQRQQIPDRLAVAIFEPSGLKRTAVTGASCRMGPPTGAPVMASQRRTAPSSLAVATSRPSGLKAIARTASSWRIGG